MNEHKTKIPEFLRKDIEHKPVPVNPMIEQLELAYYEKFGDYNFSAEYSFFDDEDNHIRILKKCLKTNRRYEKVVHTFLYKLWKWWLKPIF